MLENWFPFLVYALLAATIPASMILLSFVVATRPRNRPAAKLLPFESGVSAGAPGRQRFTISFYLTAMLFIVFDIEVVFLYPLAMVLQDLGWYGLVEFLVFVAVLVVAYVYIWAKGALDWR
jgi:NADH-quinone oxidoreductase subunit A